MKKNNQPISFVVLMLIAVMSVLVIVTALSKDLNDNRTKAAEEQQDLQPGTNFPE